MNQENRKKTTSVVVFRLGVDWFGLPTAYFKSVENLGFIHSIPRYTNDYLLGVVNVRGTVQLCFSMKSLLRVSGEKDNSGGRESVGVYRRLLVLVNNNQFYVFPVDEVGGVERIDDSTLETLPSTTNQRRAELVRGLVSTPDQRIALLNTPRIFAALEAAIGG